MDNKNPFVSKSFIAKQKQKKTKNPTKFDDVMLIGTTAQEFVVTVFYVTEDIF